MGINTPGGPVANPTRRSMAGREKIKIGQISTCKIHPLGSTPTVDCDWGHQDPHSLVCWSNWPGYLNIMKLGR